jgi:hypothetical protein
VTTLLDLFAGGDGPRPVLVADGSPVAFCWRGFRSAPAARHGEPLAVLIRIGDTGRLTRLCRWMLLPVARVRARRILAAHAVRRTAAFAIAPSCEAPTWVYELDSPAAVYADANLLPRPAGWRSLRDAVRWWTSCDVSIGALLVVGER